MNKNVKGIANGLLGGILWGLDTILIGLILEKSPFTEYVVFAPLVATFLHDTFSTLWMLLYTGFHKNLTAFRKSLTTKSGKFIIFAALFGGPLGMTGYLLAINYIGASNTAIISAMYPAFGAFLGHFFLKERIKRLGVFGLVLAISATILLGLTSPEPVENLILGFAFAFLCVIGWGGECVIIAYGMKNDVLPDIALQIRQFVSMVAYGVLIIPAIGGYPIVFEAIQSPVIWLIGLTALAGTASYLCYYRSIDDIGAIRAMGLNISYSAWAVLIGLFFGTPISIRELILSFLIVAGSILTTDNPKEFLTLLNINSYRNKVTIEGDK